ncbi:MAG TPA: hypothetical protein VFM23_08805 [Gemmatimonadales bacterium]|nr:hypothetical protein [Gemmatimonadales bacterium]
MRFARVLIALLFGLAVAGPETHACPVHSASPGHHQDAGGSHHSKGLCTCPQACCPSAVSVSLPAPQLGWTASLGPILMVSLDNRHDVVLPSRTHLLPFALPPPPIA